MYGYPFGIVCRPGGVYAFKFETVEWKFGILQRIRLPSWKRFNHHVIMKSKQK